MLKQIRSELQRNNTPGGALEFEMFNIILDFFFNNRFFIHFEHFKVYTNIHKYLFKKWKINITCIY